jgi:Cu-Zn family superoxide dismutase
MRHLIVAIGFALFASTSPSAQTPTGTSGSSVALTASARLVDTQGRNVGEARLQQTPHGVLLKLELKNATPGVHALHIHEVGRCEAPSFESAGGHFAPSARQHGFLNARGPHAGDLPNIEVPASTQLTVEHLVSDVTLEPGAQSLLDSNGSAIVIHAGKDDYATEPAGDSGDRLACGRIAPDGAR